MIKLNMSTLLAVLLFMSLISDVLASIEQVEEKIQRIDQEIERNMKVHHIPGMAFSLVDANRTIYSKGYGVLNVRDESRRIDETTNFHLGSVSKVFVSLGIIKLQEEGLLDIRMPVVHYLPWFSTKEKTSSDHITIEHLLNHSSGLPDRLNVHDLTSLDKDDVIREVQNKLEEVTLTGDPGTVLEYTNMNTDLLQFVIEEVTGQPFIEYMNEHIFTPLGMNRTGYFIFDDSHLPNTAMGHRYHWGKIRPYQEKLSYATSASAGLSSNVDDLSKFISMLLNDGQVPEGSLVSSAGIDQLFQPNQHGMGYNWYVYPHNIMMDGGLPGFTSTIVLSSDKSFGLVLLSNSKQDITNNSSFNLYRIVDGGPPAVLLPQDFPKVSDTARSILLLVMLVCVLIFCIAGYVIFSLRKGSKDISFVKPGIYGIGLLGILVSLYAGIMYYLYVELPFYIGVPALSHFNKEPDFVSGIYMFSAAITILIALLVWILLFVRKRLNPRLERRGTHRI